MVTCRIAEGDVQGWGECVPYARYGESVESVCAAIEAAREAVEAGASRESLQALMPAGAARNAVDCALWDLEAKRSGRTVAEMLGVADPRPVDTAFTISLDTADAMHRATAAVAHRSVLKVKVGAPEGDDERMRAVRAAAPHARLIIDANEGWRAETIRDRMLTAAAIGAFVVEQPLPAGQDEILSRMPRPVPVCADESVHGSDDLASLVGRYDYVNLKLDKTGGLTEGVRFLAEARRLGFGVMAGCHGRLVARHGARRAAGAGSGALRPRRPAAPCTGSSERPHLRGLDRGRAPPCALGLTARQAAWAGSSAATSPACGSSTTCGTGASTLVPGQEFERAVVALGDGRTAFHPVAAVDVEHAGPLGDLRVVDMAADHPVAAHAPRFRSQRGFEGADEGHGVLDLELRPGENDQYPKPKRRRNWLKTRLIAMAAS